MRNFQMKYEPKAWTELVFSARNADTQYILQDIANAKIAQNVILFGTNGTGKTTMARIAVTEFYARYNEPDVSEYIAMANETTNARFLPSKLNFLWSQSGVCWHILDEIDKCPFKPVYNTLHHTLDDKKGNQYILTTNTLVDLPKGLKSRAEVLTIDCPTPAEFLPRARHICNSEGIDVSDAKLLAYLTAAGEDLRAYYQVLNRL